MSQLKRLIKQRAVMLKEMQELVNFLAVLVHREEDSIEIPLEELKKLPEKQFNVEIKDGVVHIKLI